MTGVYGKYRIEKANGDAVDPEACYFVLRLDTDAAARKAAAIYAEHCGNAELTDDIYRCINRLERPDCGCREANCPHEPMFDPVWRYGNTD